MQLPPSIIRLRSNLAQLLGCLLRLIHPVTLRVGRFVHEVHARSQIRGVVAPGVQFIGSIAVEGDGRIAIGRGSRIGRRVFFETQGSGTIRIGEHVTLNDGVTIVAYECVEIGDYVMVGELASIRDANHGIAPGTPIKHQPHDAQAVWIGPDAWIGRGAYVGKGVQIGAGAVVGANSVVTREVAPNVIVGGAPARPIGERQAKEVKHHTHE